MPPTPQEKNKQDSKDEAIIIVDDEEENISPKEESPLKKMNETLMKVIVENYNRMYKYD
jgi:hypothetical protein